MNHELLFQLISIPSPSGHEERVKTFIKEYLSSIGVESRDLGPCGLFWEIGEGEKLAIVTAHIDQVSCLVDRVDDEGYIYLKMPGTDPRIAPAQEVTVWGVRELLGVVGMRPPHFVPEEERKGVIPQEKLYVDVGLSASNVKELIPPGTPCTWNVEPALLLGSRVTGTGLDNRVSVFLSLLLTQSLKSKKLPGRVRFFASTQEEGPMLGAGFAARSIYRSGENLSFAVVIDATFAVSYGVQEQAFPLGKGPTLGVGPLLSRPHLAFMRSVAEGLSIPYALEPLDRFTGTEVDVVSLTGEGIPCVLLSIPLRNMHTPVEVIDLEDVETSLTLLSAAFQREELWSF